MGELSYQAEVEQVFPGIVWQEWFTEGACNYNGQHHGRTLWLSANPIGKRLAVFDTLTPDEKSISCEVFGGLGELLGDVAEAYYAWEEN